MPFSAVSFAYAALSGGLGKALLGPSSQRKLGRGGLMRPFRLSLLLERLRRPRVYPKPLPALVRACPEVRTPLSLDLPYYAARGERGYALIPWDRYMAEAEAVLEEATRKAR